MSNSLVLLLIALAVLFSTVPERAQGFVIVEHASQVIAVKLGAELTYSYFDNKRAPCNDLPDLDAWVKPNQMDSSIQASDGCAGQMSMTNAVFLLQDTPIVPGSNITTVTYNLQITPLCNSTLDQRKLTTRPAGFSNNDWPTSYTVCDAPPNTGNNNGYGVYSWGWTQFQACHLWQPVACGDSCYDKGNVCCGGQICPGTKCCGPNKCCPSNIEPHTIISRSRPVLVDVNRP